LGFSGDNEVIKMPRAWEHSVQIPRAWGQIAGDNEFGKFQQQC